MANSVDCLVCEGQAHYTIPASDKDNKGDYCHLCLPAHLGPAAARGDYALVEPAPKSK